MTCQFEITSPRFGKPTKITTNLSKWDQERKYQQTLKTKSSRIIRWYQILPYLQGDLSSRRASYVRKDNEVHSLKIITNSVHMTSLLYETYMRERKYRSNFRTPIEMWTMEACKTLKSNTWEVQFYLQNPNVIEIQWNTW